MQTHYVPSELTLLPSSGLATSFLPGLCCLFPSTPKAKAKWLYITRFPQGVLLEAQNQQKSKGGQEVNKGVK
jgi:hypothetical protein